MWGRVNSRCLHLYPVASHPSLKEAVRLLLLRAPNASASLLGIVCCTESAPFAAAAARLLSMVAVTHPLSRHATSLHASAIVPGGVYAVARWAALAPPIDVDVTAQVGRSGYLVTSQACKHAALLCAAACRREAALCGNCEPRSRGGCAPRSAAAPP